MADAAEQLAATQREIVSFRVAQQDFCIDIGSVREIRGWTPTTVLPHAPEYITGVMNLRGAVLPVVDLSARLGLGPTEPSPRHVIIIAMIDGNTVGLLVDAVSDILTVASDEIKPTPDVAAGPAKALVEGVLAVEDRLIRLIDLDRVLPARQGDEK
jgi:purine-binding chemotaxis protein CheW